LIPILQTPCSFMKTLTTPRTIPQVIKIQWTVTTVLNILYFQFSPCSECCMLSSGWFPASEFYMPTFWNTLSVPSS
jgi:hypothetical protein